MTKQEKMAKLRKLLALSEGNANEAEANAAIAKLMKHAAEYGITLEELKAGGNEARYGAQETYSGAGNFGACDNNLGFDIAKFCCVKLGIGTDEDGDYTIKFYGEEADVELALWLRRIIKAAMQEEWHVFSTFVAREKKDKNANARDNFFLAMASRLRERMADARREQTGVTGSANALLVIGKGQELIKRAKADNFKAATGSNGRRVAPNATAWAAGAAAGGRVDLGRGVAAGTVAAIGSR